ncbi:MAG: hypothetical protein J6P03_08520 [Opitutales bacterium]|nr:hypothetical protein [Opitutales bacterium]
MGRYYSPTGRCEIWDTPPAGYKTEEEWAALHPPPPPPPPEPTPEEIAAQAAAEKQARFAAIDAASVRPLRAIAAGTATEYDREKLAALEAEAAELRKS